jgi:hypothetical protein
MLCWEGDMHNRFEFLARQMVARGLPARYVERLVRELCEHWEDALAEELEAGLPLAEARDRATRRVGEPGEIGEAAIEQFRRRTFFGRHPIMGLLLAVLALPVSWAVFFIVVLGGGLELLERWGFSDESHFTSGFLRWSCHVGAYWLCAGVACWCYATGRRCALGRRWIWGASALIALVGSFMHISFNAGGAADPTGTLLLALSPLPHLGKLGATIAVVVVIDLLSYSKRGVNHASL